MKLLIKIYLDAINPHDLMRILDLLNTNITDKDTKIYLMSNIPVTDFKPYNFCYLNETNIPKMINYNLDNLDWDIVIPIFRPIVTFTGFEVEIKKIYEEKFPKLDGVLQLNDGIKNMFNIFPVIGKNYYQKFGYIYNPNYKKTKFETEFHEIMKLTNKSFFVEKVYFKLLNIKSDDDNIYELRKKFNFGLIL
jgi:hypothetical protein